VRPSWRRWRAEIVATVVVVLLAVVGVIALWPRGAAAPAGSASPASPADSATSTDPAPDDAALAALRRQATLQPCPAAASGGATAATGPLAGLRVPCLGAPGEVDLGRALAGRPAVLNLWASWCEPCRAELPALAAYAGRPGAATVLTVNVRDTPDRALALLVELGVRLPAVSDPDGTLRAALRAPPALPTSYVLRADGSVVRVDPPNPFASADDVAAAVARYTGGAA
jgi:thiol-disulfide isomerase/thioredoxin